MKKLVYLYCAIATAIVVFVLTRFGNFVIDGSSLWQEGTFLILVPFTYLFLLFGYQTYIESKAGGWGGYVYKDGVAKWTVDSVKVPIYKASYFWMFIIALGFDTWIFISHLSDK